MAPEKVLNLFSNQEGFESADELVKSLQKNKRGGYNKHPKIYIIDPYTTMSNLYSELANYLPVPLGENEERVITESGIRGWYSIFTAESEPDQKLFQAEIIGTENFYLCDRIKLHSKLIEYLRNRVQLKDAVKLIQQDLETVQARYEVREVTQWLIKQRI